MIKGSSIPELWNQLVEQQAQKKDIIIPNQQLRAQHDDSGIISIMADDHEYQPNAWFHSQMATHLGIPQKYYKRMQEDDPTLLTTNINTWLNKSDKTRMVRTMGDTARAYLSDRYHIRDNSLVFQALLKALSTMLKENEDLKFQVQSSNLSDQYMHIKITFPGMRKEFANIDPNNHAFVNEIIEPGITLRNGEIGNSTTQINVMAMVLACLNGMILEKVHSSRHVGVQTTQTGEIRYEMDTLKADDELFVLMLRDTIVTALDEASWIGRMDKWTLATEREFKAKPAEVLEATSKRFLLTEEETQATMAALFKTPGSQNQWGLTQAITYAAHTIPSITYDRSTELELVGGQILDLDPKQWNTLALAEAA